MNRLGVGLVLMRKPGKLPARCLREEYALEYGTNTIEVHHDAIEHGQKSLVVDDVLATGGTAAAAGRLVAKMGGHLAGYAFLVELGFLKGRAVLDQDSVFSLIHIDG